MIAFLIFKTLCSKFLIFLLNFLFAYVCKKISKR